MRPSRDQNYLDNFTTPINPRVKINSFGFVKNTPELPIFPLSINNQFGGIKPFVGVKVPTKSLVSNAMQPVVVPTKNPTISIAEFLNPDVPSAFLPTNSGIKPLKTGEQFIKPTTTETPKTTAFELKGLPPNNVSTFPTEENLVKKKNKNFWWIIAVLGLAYGGYRYSISTEKKIIKTKI